MFRFGLYFFLYVATLLVLAYWAYSLGYNGF